ncbi:MAG: hypothetical protein ACRD0X_00840 [Thermoanaerobaculia bacterium]
MAQVILERIRRFIAAPQTDDFDVLARTAFAFQFERIAAFRSHGERLGVTPATLTDWREVPLVPTTAFKTLALHAAPAVETFESSGTTGSVPSRHHHPYPDLYRAVIDATFPAACLTDLDRPPMLSLVPSRAQAPLSSLSFMLDHAIARWAAADSVVAVGPRGVTVPAVRGFLAARQRDRRPTLILATAFALVQLLDALARLDLRFRLPRGSRVFETGGTKGRSREIRREELLAGFRERLDLPADRVVREYGMTELTSHFYSRVLAGGDPDLFVAPPWTRVRVLDPETLAEAPMGAPGLVAVFDLANVGSALHVLTEDLGVAEGEGFRLVGRAAGAELRGCSLTAEALAAGG